MTRADQPPPTQGTPRIEWDQPPPPPVPAGGPAPVPPPPQAFGIVTQNVRRSFGAVHAVADVSLAARRGAVTALIGPNGSGKTTLMLMLAGLLAPDSGQILVDGVNPVTDSYRARSRVGWMPDQFGTWDSLTAREVLITTGAAYRMSTEHSKARAAQLLDTVHLGDLADSPAHVLSRGQKQRLGLARALVHNPAVLILDEPANGLDPRSRIELRTLVRQLAASGTTVLISSHILAELDEMVDDAIFISRGRSVAQETIENARSNHRSWRIAALQPELLTAWLTSVGVRYVEQADGGLLIQIGGEEPASRLLRDAVLAGVPLVSLAPSGGALEQTYLSLDEDRR